MGERYLAVNQLIDHCQQSKRPAIEQLIMYKSMLQR
jgi:hypothetical protein